MMHWNEIENRWLGFSKKAHSNWNKLTIEQINAVNGNRAELSKLIQYAYQCDVNKAESDIDQWLENLLGSDPNVNSGSSMESENSAESQQLLDQKLKENQDSAETIIERDEIVGSPYHKGY